MASRLRPAGILVCCAALLGTLTGCSTMGGGDRDATSGGNASGAGTLTVVTHDSFELPDELLAQFREQSGYEVTVLRSGDAGTLTNKLVLTKSNPIGDVAFGICPPAWTVTCSPVTRRVGRSRWTSLTCASTSTPPGSPRTR